MTDTSPLPPEARSIVMRLGPLWAVSVRHGRDGRTSDREMVRVVFDNLTDSCSAIGVWVDGLFETAAAWTHCTDPRCPIGGGAHPAVAPNRITLDELETVVTDEPRLGWGAA